MSRLRLVSNEEVLATLEILEEDTHSRTRTYPYLAAGIGLTASASALTMGTIVEVIPVLADEVDTLQITHACDVAGFVTIDLNGVPYTKAVAAGAVNAVAAQLRGYTYGDWVVTGDTDKVIFTRSGLATTAVLKNLGTTGVTGTFTKTNTGAGIHDPFDIHALQLGLMGTADTYIVTLYKGLAGYEERIVSRRVTTAANNNTVGGETSVGTPLMPAGTRISASLASVGGGAGKTAVVSVSYHWYE